MESDKLYRVQKEDLPKVEKMLNQCCLLYTSDAADE